MKDSHIQWTNSTFNPWEGCQKVSPGCLHCYAETRNIRFAGGVNWGPGAPRRRTSVSNWNGPRKWNREAVRAAVKHRVFCASLADWLDDAVDIAWLVDLLILIRDTPHLDWLLLTKRPQNWRARIQLALEHSPVALQWLIFWLGGHIPYNIWAGTTVEDQKRADERIPKLLDIPSRVHFLSCEPLLEAVDLMYPESLFPGGPSYCCSGAECGCMGQPTEPPLSHGIDWVICGAESGPERREMKTEWASGLRMQCRGEKIPFFMKQMNDAEGQISGELSAFPPDLQVREHPKP